MRTSISFGRIAGIPVGAHWSVLVLPVIIADALGSSLLPAAAPTASSLECWLVAVVVALAFLGSLLAHELAHAVVARRAGLRVGGITLWMLGGVTVIEGEMPTPTVDLRVAVVGPATSLAVAAASGGLSWLLAATGGSRVVVVGAQWLAATNGLLGVFNLLPGAPLDGGRVLRAIVWRRTGDRVRGETAATRSGRAAGLLLIGLGAAEALATHDLVGGLWLVLIGWFLHASATAEQVSARTRALLAAVLVREVTDPRMVVVPDYLEAGAAARVAVDAEVEWVVVTDFEGHVIGFVTAAALVAAASGTSPRRVREVARPVADGAIAAPDELVTAALTRAEGRLPLVTVAEGQVLGVVTDDALRRATERQLLMHPQAA